MHYIMRVHHILVRLLAGIAGVCVAFLIIGIGAEAIMRSLGIGLIKGIIDLAEYSLFLIAILAAPWLVSQNGHIRVDILLSQLQGRARQRAEWFVNFVVMCIALVILYYSTLVFTESLLRGEMIFRELIFPDWWVQWQMPLAMLLISIELAHRLFAPSAAAQAIIAATAVNDDALSLPSGQGGQ